MRAADTAMYHAKEMGRANFQFFTDALNQAVQQRLDVGNRVRQALAHDEFILRYQPQVRMASGIAFSAEALLRWQAPGAEPVSCADFIANAEESGLIVPLGEWVVRDLGQDRNDTALVTAIIAMAGSLQLGVIAEGVETLQQVQFLMAHGCHDAQGFFYSKALRGDVVSEMIERNAPFGDAAARPRQGPDGRPYS